LLELVEETLELKDSLPMKAQVLFVEETLELILALVEEAVAKADIQHSTA
jgi:hypothetical protein